MQPKITRITEAPQFDESGRLRTIVRVEFTVGPHGPFTESFDRETFDFGVVRARLEQFASQLRQLVQ
jgi:hypothetical protein